MDGFLKAKYKSGVDNLLHLNEVIYEFLKTHNEIVFEQLYFFFNFESGLAPDFVELPICLQASLSRVFRYRLDKVYYTRYGNDLAKMSMTFI